MRKSHHNIVELPACPALPALLDLLVCLPALLAGIDCLLACLPALAALPACPAHLPACLMGLGTGSQLTLNIYTELAFDAIAK